jgi:hypothetical protein
MVQRRRACLYMIDRLSTKISSSIKVQVGLVQLLFALHESVCGTSPIRCPATARPQLGADQPSSAQRAASVLLASECTETRALVHRKMHHCTTPRYRGQHALPALALNCLVGGVRMHCLKSTNGAQLNVC